MVKVCFTADKYTPESLELGTPAESGYVNLDWNRFQIMESGDEWTKPFDTIAEAKQFIEDSIGETEASNDSYYGIDSVMDSDGNTWSYAGHIDD